MVTYGALLLLLAAVVLCVRRCGGGSAEGVVEKAPETVAIHVIPDQVRDDVDSDTVETAAKDIVQDDAARHSGPDPESLDRTAAEKNAEENIDNDTEKKILKQVQDDAEDDTVETAAKDIVQDDADVEGQNDAEDVTADVHEEVKVEAVQEEVVQEAVSGTPSEESPARHSGPGPESSDRSVLAIKTNLLYDLAFAPNIEIEFPFAKDRFSVMAEWWAPWWHGRDNSWCYQLLYGGVEGRVWFGDRTRRPSLSGHFAGVYGGYGAFDLELDNKGYQCLGFWSAGVTYGYSFPIHKSLRIETSVSFGYLSADYEHYEAVENGQYLAWKNDGRFSWAGPTKAKVSLSWTIPSGRFSRGGGR